MAITCALGPKHIKALTKVISKAMLTSLEKGEAFDINAFMNKLYTNLKERQGLDNAMQYMQQVPYIANRIDAKLEVDLSKDADGNEINLKTLSKSFRNEDTGIQTVMNYFEKTVTPKELATIAKDNANRPVEKYENVEEKEELPIETYEDERLKARNIFSATHEEFFAKTPGTISEEVDKTKLHIINTIGRISLLSRNIDALDSIKLDGVDLKLKAIPISRLSNEQLTEYTKNIIATQRAIESQGTGTGKVTPIGEQFALVLTDPKGDFVYFAQDGTVTTKENGGKIVYQMLRDVRKFGDKYMATDIYGIENQIITPQDEAKRQLKESGLTKTDFEDAVGMSYSDYVVEVDRQQQEKLKQVYDFKNTLVKENKTALINLAGASRGVLNNRVSKNVNLRNISILFPEIKNDIIKSITNLETNFSGFRSGRTIVQVKGEYFELDRSQIDDILAKKIADVLTNPKLKKEEKFSFYTQFFTKNGRSEKIDLPSGSQRHDLYFEGTDLVFGYVPNTALQAKVSKLFQDENKELKTIDLNDPKAAEDIKKILRSGWSYSGGEVAGSNISYNTALIKGDQKFFDYENGKLIESKTSYIDFLFTQNGKLIISPEKAIPLFNAYLTYNFDNVELDRITKAKEAVKDKVQEDSEIRKFKDALVVEMKTNPEAKLSAEVVKVKETSVSDTLNQKSYSTYTITVKIDGKEGEHLFYQSENNAAKGDILSVQLNPIVIKDGFGYPNNISLTKVEGGKIKYFGDLAETDFKAKEARRLPIPMQQDYVAEKMEEEALDEVQVAPKTVSEEESEIQQVQGLNPSDTENPSDKSNISDLFKRFKLDRKTNLPNGVTGEQVENAINWWNNSPLNKYIALEQVANIVNSDAYARFLIAGSTMLAGQYTGKLGAIQINKATGGSLVDTYHEAWHGFSQLFLTRQEKIDLYNELKKSNPKYKEYSFLELEEILAEDFRSYALNQNTKPKSPKRNTLFRRILNFLKKLFGGDTSIADNIQPYNVESQGVAGELFRNLYLASSNPDLLNIYTPSIDNVMFDILNRGIMQVGSKNEPALNQRDSEIVNDSVDSLLSEVVDDNFDLRREADPLTANKAGTTKIITDLENREVAYEIVKEKFKERLKTLRDKLKTTPEKPFASFNTLQNLEDNASAVIRSNKGDHKYVFLKSQIDDYNNLSLATKAGQRVKGEIYKKTIEVIGDFYTHNSIKDTTKDNATILVVDTIEEAKAQFDSYREGGAESFDKFQINPLVNAKSTYEISLNQARILDSIRILQTAIRHWDSVIKYNQSNSDYEIVKKEYAVEPTKGEQDATEDVTQSEKVKSEVGKETLFELAGKDVVYILRSLHKKIKVGDTYVNEFNELGFKKRADFRKVWATLVKATQGTKDPQEMYRKIVEASANFEELKQLIEYKLPVPDQSNTSYEFDITTSFWSVFSLPKVQYKQLSLFKTEEGLTTEVTSGSLDVKNVVKSFQSNFQSDKNNAYAIVSKDNVSYLNLDKVVNTFSKAGEFDDSKTIDFLKAIGINLEDTTKLKEEILNLKNRTYYGVPYIFDTIKELNILDKKGVKTKEENELLAEFKLNPILVLSKGIPAKTIGEKGSKYYKEGSKQKTQIERIAELQMTLGFGINSMSASNAEGNKVNEVTTDNTLTFLADALNTVDSRTDMYRKGNPLRFLDPKNNPWASSSITLKNLFSASDARDGKRNIIVDLVSGTQRTDVEITDGQNTTNLSQQGKLIQDVHTLLKSGIVETMRPGSKSSAWSWRIEGGIQVGIGKRNESYLYADIDSFIPQSGKERGVIESLILPYLDSELKRINIYKTNPKAKNYIGYNAKANQQGEAYGEIFNVFNGVLTNKTQNKLKELITDPNVSLLDYLEENTDLKNEIIREVYSYFTNKTNELYNQYNEASYFDPKLMNKLSQINISETEKQKILLKAFFYNNWIHNVETSILFFSGDIAQLDHSKENGHKRTSGLISNGPRLRTDIAAQKYISNVDEGGFSNSTYARTLGEKYDKFRYDGYVNTAVIQDIARDSIYAPEMRARFEKDLKAKYPRMSDSEVKKLVEKKVSKYLESEIKEGDGQGYITLDAYRAFKKLQNKWSNDQERLYQRVIKGEEISLDDLTEGFPVYKLQNFGFAEDTVLPVGIMHKFALFPLIPSAIKGTELEELHKKMLEDNIQYATFASGSKTGGVTSDGKPDQIFEEGGKKIKADAKFTNNRIHAGFIKEVTNVPSKLKGEVIFSTQLRKLILEGLYEHGSYTSERSKELAKNYTNIVDFYTDVLTKELETEIGYRKDEKGIYIGKPDKFLKLIQRNLEQKDYPNHIIDTLKLNPDGTLNYDLSYFIDTEGIENIVMSIINKKLVKQKVNGEALVQVASSMWNGSWDAYQGNKFKNLKGKELEEATKKFLGTNNLPFYTEGADGKTSAMKVAIALQGDFFNLLNLLDNDGKKIGTIERLNEMIKDEDWLNKDNNRKSVTMTAVRIPVQGLNSMEFMEVYEFLDPTAQNVIILPTEIVGKSGGDYDVDKLTTFFPNINEDGSYAISSVSNNKFTEEITNIESAGKNPKEFIKNQKRAVQNEMIQAIRSILEIPENYTSLLTPNDTDILKPLADDLQKYVSPRDKYAKANGEQPNISAKGKKMISPTSMFEPLYNNEKFGANMGGKGVLGIFANDNALHPLLTSVGYKMPKKYKAAKWNERLKRWVEKGKAVYDMRLFLPHNTVDGHISLSNINTINGTKIADLYSQGVNGSVDVEADEWIFYIQGNLEVASNLSYLIKAGVPEDTAVYFVSNPLVREYAKRQRLAKGVFGEATETGSVISQMTQYDSANYVFRKYIPQFIKNKLENLSPNEDLKVVINEPSPLSPFGEDVTYEYKASDLLNNLDSILSDPSLTIKNITVQYNNAPAYLLYNQFNPSTKKIYETSTFLSGMPGVKKNNQFNTDELYKLITNKGELSQQQLDLALAGFAHFLEIEKQIKGLAALKRQIKPDVITLRTTQEAVMKNLNIDLVFDNSKVDTETANKAINESAISRFGNTEIIEKIFMPLMPLVNGDKVSRFIADSIGGYGESSKNKIDTISKFYGSGQDGVSRFINSFKTGVKTFIFQNYLSNFIDINGSLTTLPNKYYGQTVKINNNLDTDVAVINGEFIVNEKRVTQDFEQKRYLSDNTQPGNYSSREGLVPFDLANDVFNTKELYFKYVLERERLFFLGLRGDELNQMALVNSFNPNVLLGNNKYSYTDLLLNTIDKHRKSLSKNYDIIDQIRKAVELKNVNVLTLSNKRTLTGSEQSRYATELKALGNTRIQKVDDPEENTRISKLFRLLPLINIYQHGVGKTFYGFDFALPQDDYIKTMTAAGDLFKNNYDNAKTFDLVFKKLTESKSRVKNLVVSPEEYNSYVPLKAEYVEPLDLDEDQVFEAQKPVFTAPTTQPTEVNNPFKTSKIQQKVYHVDKRKNLNEETIVDDYSMVYPAGVFFTTEREYAENYAKAIDGTIYEAYVDIQNPLSTIDKQEIETLGRQPDRLPENVDSVIYESYDEKADKYGKVGTEIVVYKPEQIKLIQLTQPTATPTTAPVVDEVADIERRREEELDRAGLSDSKLKNVDFINQKELVQRNDINAKYDAELAALKEQQQAPINYNNVPKVQVQPTLEPGRYVNFDNNIWIVTKQNTNGTWQIYNPNLEGVNSKKSVAEKNLGIRPEIAKIVTYRGQEYLVTPNETIISLVSNKKMKWNSNDGNRIGILQLANNTISSTQPTIPVSKTTDDYTFTFADGTPIFVPFKLNEQQQQALLDLEKFYNNPEEYNNEIALIGYAGTGKTTIMSLFDKYLMSKGEIPKYSAPTHRANAVTALNNPNADVITLHKAFGLSPDLDLTNGQLSIENLESSVNSEPKISYGDYLIIDESSMITDQLYGFIEQNKKDLNIKVIYMGDPAQLAPVDTKKKETSVSVALKNPFKLQLTKVERTGDNPILAESTNLREGRPLSGISDEVDGKGVEYISDSARTNQVIGQSLQEMQETGDFLHFRMLSAKNSGLKLLNDLARKNLYNVDDTTQLVDGDILMGNDNFGGTMNAYDIYNSGDYRVISTSKEITKKIKTETSIGDIEFKGYEVTLEDLLDKSSEKVKLFIATNGVNQAASKQFISAISALAKKAKEASTRQSRGMYFAKMFALKKQVAFMEDLYNDYGEIAIKKTLGYGYAHSIHKSQGGTYNKVLVLLDTIDNSKFDTIVRQQLRYVAVSRARDYVYLVKNSGPLSQTTEDVSEVERTPDDNVMSSITLEQLTKGKPTVASKAAAELPMDDSNITKIINGTKVITNRTALFTDGIYTIGGIQQVRLKYLGKGVVVGNNVVITDENTKQSLVRSKDDFAKAEGFKSWSDFELNNKFSQKFISGESARYIYSVKPMGEIKEEFGASQKLDPENNPVIAAFNQKLIENKGTLPKEFMYQNGLYPNKYVLNPNNLYNLVDVETGTIYLRNINLQTGDIVSIDEPLVPVSDKRVAEIISGLRSQIKAYRLDEILAEKGIDINEEIDKLENVNFESELNEIMVRINKNMC
jgi:hypothetical protein